MEINIRILFSVGSKCTNVNVMYLDKRWRKFKSPSSQHGGLEYDRLSSIWFGFTFLRSDLDL